MLHSNLLFYFVSLILASNITTQPSTENGLPESACGPAAVYWAASHLNRPIPLDHLLNQCRDSRGCSIDELCDLAKRAGLFTEVVELKPNQFPDLTIPAIGLRLPEDGDVGHYVLIRGLGHNTFVIADLEGVQELKVADLPPEIRQKAIPSILLSASPEQLQNVMITLVPLKSKRRGSPYETVLSVMIIVGALLFSWGIIREKHQQQKDNHV